MTFLLLYLPAISSELPSGDSVKTNAALLRGMVDSLIDSIVQQSSMQKGSSTAIQVSTSEGEAFVQQIVVAGLLRFGYTVYVDDTTGKSSQYLVKFTGVELATGYGETFHQAFLGESKSKRTVSIVLPVTVTEIQTGKVIHSKTFRAEFSDTVATDWIPMLEQDQIPGTQAPLPEHGFFDKLIEPLIIIGATGVAIFLFFHVRS